MPNGVEAAVSKRSRRAEQKRRDAGIGPSEIGKVVVPLLGHLVALLAMKTGRAPLPVSSALCKSLVRRGLVRDLEDLGDLARRYLFLGDERMLLAELERHVAWTPREEK